MTADLHTCDCVNCAAMPVGPDGFHIDPKTNIRPLHEWGNWCARGFVSDVRFAGSTEQVIARNDRSKTKKVYRSKL